MNYTADNDKTLINWFGRISVISFGLALLVWNESDARNKSSLVFFLSFLCVSTLLALIAAYKRQMGWLYLIPPSVVWLFIITIKLLGPFH